jgi:hypothetical protein
MKTVIGVIGVLAVLLGGLWLLQGLGMVHMKPILCFADCATLQGPSTTWAVIGAVVAAAGLPGAFYGFKRR